MTRLHALLAAAVLLPAAPAQAHDFWIEPDTFRPATGAQVRLTLRVGQHFSGESRPYVPQFFERFVYAGPQGERPVAGELGDDPAGRLTAPAPGMYVVAYRGRQDYLELEPKKFDSYLEDEGLETIIRERARRGESDKKSRELYSRCAKSLVAAGGAHGAGYDRSLKLTLELTPEKNPYALAAGDTLPVRLLYQGKPLAGALVVAFRREEPMTKLKLRTGRDGRVALKLSQPGAWLVKSVHMVRVPAGGTADWESFWASLTFELPARSAAPPAP